MYDRAARLTVTAENSYSPVCVIADVLYEV